MSPRSLAIVLGMVWLGLVWRTGPPGGDFANYWTAAGLWLGGADLTLLYDFGWFNRQSEAAGFGDRPTGFPVLTPPSVLFAVPLHPLGLPWGERAWQWGQAGLGLVLAWTTARALRRELWVGLAGLLLAWPALRAHLAQGQFHLPAAVALALGFWAWTRNRGHWAGVGFGLAAGLKVHAWPLVPLFALVRGRRVVQGAAVTVVLGAVASVSLLGVDVHLDWWTTMAAPASEGRVVDPWHPALQSVAALTRHWFVPDVVRSPDPLWSAPWLAEALRRGVSTFLLLCTWAASRRWDGLWAAERQRVVAAAALAALVGGPAAFHYHWVLALPPVLWALDGLWRAERPVAALLLLLTALGCFWVPSAAAWPSWAPLGVLRLWLGLALWAQVLPWPGRRDLGWVVLVSGLWAALPRAAHDTDGAQPLLHPSQPLIASDLLLDGDGLRMSGFDARREGLPGTGWMGYRVDPVTGEAVPVQATAGTHTWPTPEGWGTGAVAARPQAVDCRGATLAVRDGDLWWGAVRLTRSPAREASPVCDPERGRAWFLSDRHVGAGTHRIWWVALPDSAPSE